MPEVAIGGVPGSGAWAALALSLLHRRERFPGLPQAAPPLTLVRGSDEEIEDLADALAALLPLFPEAPIAPRIAVFGDDAQVRLGSLEILRRGAEIVLATPDGLRHKAPLPGSFDALRLELRRGRSYPRAELLERLTTLGHQRVDFVESPGEFALRGSVVDIFPLEPVRAVRLNFNEERLESLRLFDPETQAGGEFIEEASLTPAQEAGFEAAVADWLSGRGLWACEAGVELPPVKVGLLRVGSGGPGAFDFGIRPGMRFEGNVELALEQVRRWREQGLRVLFFSLNRGEDERVQELLEGRADCQFLIGPLRSGFVWPTEKLAVLSSSELFERSYRGAPRWGRYGDGSRRRLRWKELKSGDYVVHRDYGISRYLGIEPVESGEAVIDCLRLEFRGSDKLYVPMTDFKLVQKYVGSEGRRPRLSSLDTRSWEAVKARVREGVRELAEELLKVQAARAAWPGHAFGPDSHMEREFAASFPYEETPDQRRAIEEVKADMMRPHPMDRVVIGDVGFGKTEVAMRAALKCASGLKQAAVLVPTTILADQHFRTFSKRFAEYPVRLGMLSRFETPSRQKKTLDLLASGALDIVIGTQRLLSPDVKFKDLGLIVVDEEHRFGVRDKERLKGLKKNVDVLSLSATPIPRTLHQSLSGLRSVSIIRSAPAGRQPIMTRVGPWDEKLVAAAIEAELSRGGQVYYVHNRVRTLDARADALRKLVAGIRVCVAHGQMRSETLEKTMWDFFNRKHDLLAASTIIESGLDIPTVNTLIVEDAQDFGLAQLYQLRGRIGRERQKAFCYLLHPPGSELAHLSEESRKRLEALREFGELGSGLQLAMRDLEIRGAGDLLGAKQHGFVDAVGVEFYSELLGEEIEKLKGGAPKPAVAPVHLDVELPAFIPEEYLPGEMERLEFYKRLIDAGPEQWAALRRELEDLSGPAPRPVVNLFRLFELRAKASAAGLRALSQRDNQVEVYFRPDAQVAAKTLLAWQRDFGGRLEFRRSPEGDGLRIQLRGEEPIGWVESFVTSLNPKSV